MSDFIVALDQGSSSSRALAFDAAGDVVARVQAPVRTYSPRPGWVEHDAEELCESQERALDRLLARLPRRGKVQALAFACQRSTVVLWDARTGKAICRVPSWQDARAAESVAPMHARQAEIHAKTGLYLTPYYSAPKIRFLMQSEPRARVLLKEGRLRIGPVSSYLLWRWSGGRIFACDPSMAQRTLLFNLQSGGWDESLLDAFGIARRCLPEILPSAGNWGSLSRQGRELPVRACLGDQQAAAYGMGSRPGVGVLNYGTGAFVLLNVGTNAARVPGLLTSVAWREPAAAVPQYLLEGTVHSAGSSLEWLRRLGLLKDVRGADAACSQSKRRIWALAAIGGLGAPRWDYRTPSAYFGLDAQSEPADLVRATIESVAFLVSDIVSAMREAGHEMREARVSGGLSELRYLMRFQADLLGLPLRAVAEKEATALGAAALAGREIGWNWKRAERAFFRREYTPGISGDEAARLRSRWRCFVQALQNLSAQLQ